MSYASARFDMSSQTGECCQPGVDSAHSLFSQTNSVFVFQSCARLSDSWKVPVFVAPSPKNATATRGSSRSLNARPGADERRQPAADDGVRAEVAALDVVEVHRAAVAVRAALDLPVELRHQRVRVRAARERVPVGAMGRAEDVAVLHRGADADLGRLLPDRDVEEPGQLAGAKPLLDLLLEPPDQEHLAQEVPEPVLGQGAPLLDLRHCALSVRSAADGARHDWQELQAELPDGWVEARLRLHARGAGATRPGRRAARAAPAAAARARLVRVPVARGGTARAAEALRRALAAARRRALHGRLELDRLAEADAALRAGAAGATCAESWDAALADAPGRLERPARRDRARLLRLPRARRPPPGADQPAPDRQPLRLQFRSARRFGYGASPGMVRRCLERCDADGIRGSVEVLRALSDTRPVGTQGPVWQIDGRMV